MLQNILSQIDTINESLAWIKKNKPNDYSLRFLDLVEERRKLKVLARAAEDNPAIAAFGMSQVGKSYLMSCLLQDKGKPFMVEANGKQYDFIAAINPIGDGQEATGVVTRFSSFLRDKQRYSEKYPALVRTLSVIDIILILSDSYFNDFSNYTTYGEKELEEECERLREKYSSMEEIANPVLEADDILEIKQYFKKHINNAQVYNRSAFFDEISLLINHIPVSDYAAVFSMLWHCDANITALFSRLLDTLAKVRFSKYIYLPIEAVVHEGIKENTVMSVTCLSHLLDSANQYNTHVYLRSGDNFDDLGEFSKSEVCAICSEVVFKIGAKFLSSTDEYKTEFMSGHTASRLTKGEIKMSILESNDLLDFPGARAREVENIENLSKPVTLLNGYLRGKVAYLFNKYNEARSINILLYCHYQKNNDATSLWRLLADWVNTYVGATPEERRKTVEKCGGVAPLFHIGTMFNMDMAYHQNPVANTPNALEQRWTGRFDTVLLRSCFHAGPDSWVRNWCAIGSHFNNCYMLRDFKYSGPSGSQLYSGWKETQSEQAMIIDRSFYDMLKRTFVENPVVKKLFEDPELSWDVAASQNNDGALYIIEKLSVVASHMVETRRELFTREMGKIRDNVRKQIVDYYKSENNDDILRENIRKAKKVFREMDFTCNNDNYYFGHLLQALQITEAQSYTVIHKILQSPDLNKSINNFEDYEIIRNRCAQYGYDFDNLTPNERWDALFDVYMLDSKEEAIAYLNSKNVDPDILISGGYCTRKLNSCIIADELFDAWCNRIKSVDFMKRNAGDCGFDNLVMSHLIENIIISAETIGLRDKMANLIAEYVNVIDVHSANESFLADILADAINDYILDLGYSDLKPEEIESVRNLAQSQHLPIFRYVGRTEVDKVYTEADLTALFDDMSTNPKALVPSFENQYNKWIEYMFISFVSHLQHPDYDPEANEALRVILEKL